MTFLSCGPPVCAVIWMCGPPRSRGCVCRVAPTSTNPPSSFRGIGDLLSSTAPAVVLCLALALLALVHSSALLWSRLAFGSIQNRFFPNRPKPGPGSGPDPSGPGSGSPSRSGPPAPFPFLNFGGPLAFGPLGLGSRPRSPAPVLNPPAPVSAPLTLGPQHPKSPGPGVL